MLSIESRKDLTLASFPGLPRLRSQLIHGWRRTRPGNEACNCELARGLWEGLTQLIVMTSYGWGHSEAGLLSHQRVRTRGSRAAYVREAPALLSLSSTVS